MLAAILTDPTFTGGPTFDESVSYVFDANDRLLSETFDAPGTVDDRFTAYEYGPNATSSYGGDHTTRTKKTVYQGLDSSGPKRSEDGYTYTRQGRLWIAQRDTDGDGAVDQTLKYEYNDNGVRVSSEVDGIKTLLLVDENNPTGYAQVLEELDAALAVIRSYTLGLDVLMQSSSGLPSPAYSLLYDGHGSVRSLLDTSGLIVPGQVYRFDAYGNAIGFDPANALTGLLYSGELYDSQLQLQYLRARWYDLSTGTFNRLDPFFGNLQDPQSLHKYAYVHGDPVMGVDPTGLFSFSLSGLTLSMNIAGYTASINLGAYFASAGVSYAIGKGATIGYLYYRDGNLDKLRWFEYWDLLNLIPGVAWARFARLPLQLVRLVPGKGFVGRLFLNPGTARITQMFARLYPSLWRRVLPNGRGLYLSSGKKGFRHLIERHLAQFFAGGTDDVLRKTTFWPVGTHASDVIAYLDEAIQLLGNQVVFDGISQVRLANGLSVKIFVARDGRIASFFPVAGRGVTRAINVLKELL